MKRYCKEIDITSLDIIRKAIYDCLDGKYYRNEVARLLAKQNILTLSEVKDAIKSGERYKLDTCIEAMADDIQQSLIDENVVFKPIIWQSRIDGNSGKTRIIGAESIWQQIYDYIAVAGIETLCKAKIGYYQCACMKGRGQVYGKKAIEKWLRKDTGNTKYCVKCDIKQCYPSIKHDLLLKFLHRDIKNNKLLWLLEILLNSYDKGLSIGSYLSQYLCNYYLSYAYHYAAEQLATEQTRRGKTKRVRLISHILFYMDDIILLSGNKRHLKKAFEMFTKYVNEVLQLTIKKSWRLFRVEYIDKNGKTKGSIIDIMGYKIGRVKTTVRRRIFLRFRKKVNKIDKLIKSDKHISRKAAASVVSLAGWFKHSNGYNILIKYKAVIEYAKKEISRNAKEENKNVIQM